MKCAFLMVLVAASVAAAQVSTQEAQARLDDRRAHAATQPSADELAEYKQLVAELRAENAKLRAEIAELKAQAAAEDSGRVKWADSQPAEPSRQFSSLREAIDDWKAHVVGKSVNAAYSDAKQMCVDWARAHGGRRARVVAPSQPAMVGSNGQRQEWRMSWGSETERDLYYYFVVRDGKIIAFTAP